MTLNNAISLLRRYVKESAVPGQMHISPDLVNVEDLPLYEEAMEVANNAVIRGELTRDELLGMLGLK